VKLKQSRGIVGVIPHSGTLRCSPGGPKHLSWISSLKALKDALYLTTPGDLSIQPIPTHLHPFMTCYSCRKEVVSVLKKHLSVMRMGCNEIEEEAAVPMTLN